MKPNIISFFMVMAMSTLVASAMAMAPPTHLVGVENVGYHVEKTAVTQHFATLPTEAYPAWFASLDAGTASIARTRTVSATLPAHYASPVDALDTGQYFAAGSHANYYYGKMDDAWRVFAIDDGFATADDIPAVAESG